MCFSNICVTNPVLTQTTKTAKRVKTGFVTQRVLKRMRLYTTVKVPVPAAPVFTVVLRPNGLIPLSTSVLLIVITILHFFNFGYSHLNQKRRRLYYR